MKSDVTTRVSDLSAGLADPTSTDHYYDVVVQDLARYPWLTNVSLVPVTAGTSQYTLADSQVKLVAMFYGNAVLDRLSLQEAEYINVAWRDEVGTPVAYVVEDEAAKTFRLYPNPNVNSANFIFAFGEPLGRDYPANSVAIIHTETRTNLPVWLELPIALEVLAREFTHESNHRDPTLAMLAHQLSDMLFKMVA